MRRTGEAAESGQRKQCSNFGDPKSDPCLICSPVNECPEVGGLEGDCTNGKTVVNHEIRNSRKIRIQVGE